MSAPKPRGPTQSERLKAVEQLTASLVLDMERAKAAALAAEKQAKETHDMVAAMNTTFMVRRPGDDAPLAEQLGRMVRDYDKSKFTVQVVFALMTALPVGAFLTWLGFNRGQ